jgi:3-oxoadipate enol-lactonase
VLLTFDDVGSGVPVVLLHGQPGSRGDWSAVVSFASGVRLIAVDRPGYGSSPGPAVGVGANGDVVIGLLDSLSVERAVLVGHSWGGAVALDVAARFPERVRSLVLAASVGGDGSIEPIDRLLGAPVVGPLMTMGALAATRASFVRRLAGVTAPLSASSWRSFVIEQRALALELPRLVAQLDSITAPAWVLIGLEDRVVRPAVQEALAAALGARVTRIPGCAHLLPWEAPEVVAAAILQASLSP